MLRRLLVLDPIYHLLYWSNSLGHWQASKSEAGGGDSLSHHQIHIQLRKCWHWWGSILGETYWVQWLPASQYTTLPLTSWSRIRQGCKPCCSRGSGCRADTPAIARRGTIWRGWWQVSDCRNEPRKLFKIITPHYQVLQAVDTRDAPKWASSTLWWWWPWKRSYRLIP